MSILGRIWFAVRVVVYCIGLLVGTTVAIGYLLGMIAIEVVRIVLDCETKWEFCSVCGEQSGLIVDGMCEECMLKRDDLYSAVGWQVDEYV